MIDVLDLISLKGATFCLEEMGNFVMAEEMLVKLSSEAAASSAAAALRQRIRDAQTAFWQARCRFASVVTPGFPNYLSGHLYAELCRSRIQSGISTPEADLTSNPNLGSEPFAFSPLRVPLFRISATRRPTHRKRRRA